jgi:hypothetical protein
VGKFKATKIAEALNEKESSYFKLFLPFESFADVESKYLQSIITMWNKSNKQHFPLMAFIFIYYNTVSKAVGERRGEEEEREEKDSHKRGRKSIKKQCKQ